MTPATLALRAVVPRRVVVPMLALLAAAPGCAVFGEPASDARSTPRGQETRTPSGLVYTVVKVGSGPAARPGQQVLIHETTTFPDGRVLYSTRPGGEPLRFMLGGEPVVDGVDEGVTGMRVGERRTMIVPPALSRRREYPQGLSPHDTLHDDVELVAIEQVSASRPPGKGALAVAPVAARIDEDAEVLAIERVDVIPVSTPGLLKKQTVLVRGDRIAAVGPAASSSSTPCASPG